MDFGLTTRVAGNRLNSTERTNPCPSDRRRDAIVAALVHFEMQEAASVGGLASLLVVHATMPRACAAPNATAIPSIPAARTARCYSNEHRG